MGNQSFEIDGHSLRIHDVIRIAESIPGEIGLKLSQNSLERIKKSREVLEAELRHGKTIYGVNTGFGALLNKKICQDDIRLHQRNLILSHSAQVDEPIPIEITKATMLIRANTLSQGYSGVRPIVIETLLEMLRRGVVPVVPSRGSVGASGDLAPLSHIAIVLSKDPRDEYQRLEDALAKEVVKKGKLSEESRKYAILLSGEAYFWGGANWIRMTGIEAMTKARIPRIILEAKEGLALNNGTTFSTALACYVIWYANRLIEIADRIAALSIEAIRGVNTPFSKEVMEVRPHKGQSISAMVIRNMLQGSKLLQDLKKIKSYGIQDPYSFRCVPQVHGPVRDTLTFAQTIVEREINSTTDNPLIFTEGETTVVSAGNFHAEYIGYVLDFLAIALTGLSGISERRTYSLLDERKNRGLPPFLVNGIKPGLQTGLMLAQYTAASLVSENKTLSHPSVVDSIPTSAGQEDYVSMAPVSGLKALQILKNTEYVLAIETLCAFNAIRLRLNQLGLNEDTLGKGTRNLFLYLKNLLGERKEDYPIHKDIEILRSKIHCGEILNPKIE